MRYGLRVVPSTRRELRALPKDRYPAIRDAITALRTHPRPPGSVKLTGSQNYRVRIGDYRIVYEVDDAEQIVTILRVAHRREVYRD
jgi:mRNA interferase RelE/StbE